MAKHNKQIFTLITGLWLLISAGMNPLAAEEEHYAKALLQIEIFHNTLLDVMQSDSDFEARYKTLFPVVTGLFDFDNICRVIFSRHWRKLEATPQEDIKNLMVELTVSQYANHFSSYAQEEFSTQNFEKSRRDRIIIKTDLVTADKEVIHLDYLMHEVDGKWKIISVIANGVNDLALKRAEYSDVIEKQGVPVLITKITEKINKFRNP